MEWLIFISERPYTVFLEQAVSTVHSSSSSIYFFKLYNGIIYYNLNVSVQSERKTILVRVVTYLLSNILRGIKNVTLSNLCLN